MIFLLDGKLDIYVPNDVLFSSLKSGDFFEPISMFSQIQPLLPLHIRARTNCIVTPLEQSVLLPLFDRDPVLSRNYMKLSADWMQHTLCRLEHLTAATPSVALALYLLRNHSHSFLKLTDGFAGLARRLNISRATLYRALSELEQHTLVTHHEKTIQILNLQELSHFAHSYAQLPPDSAIE